MRRKQFAVFGVGACTCVLELFCASASAPAPARPVISVHLTATYHDATVWKDARPGPRSPSPAGSRTATGRGPGGGRPPGGVAARAARARREECATNPALGGQAVD